MKEIILALCLSALSFNATAGWTLINSDDELDVYVDSATIRKVGNKVKMWSLKDYKTAQSDFDGDKPYLSATTQKEYDCRAETVRLLYMTNYAYNMAKGTVTYSNNFNSSKVDPVGPGTIGEASWKAACGRK